MKLMLLLFVVVAFVKTACFAETNVDEAFEKLVGSYWKTEILENKINDHSPNYDGETYLVVYKYGRVNLSVRFDSKNWIDIDGYATADSHNLYITLDKFHKCENGKWSGDFEKGSVLTMPYKLTKTKNGDVITLTFEKNQFSLTKVGSYNLWWGERECGDEKYYYPLNGYWSNGGNRVSFRKRRIEFWADDTHFEGIFSADEKNLYVSLFDSGILGEDIDYDKFVIPYTIFEKSDGHRILERRLELIVTGKKYSFNDPFDEFDEYQEKISCRTQRELDGKWKAEKTLKTVKDWNVTLKIKGYSFIVDIENNGEPVYSALCDVFYENGAMCFISCDALEDEGIEYAVYVAMFYEMVEYLFFGRSEQSLCAYRLEKNTLTLSAFGKDLVFHKVDEN